ncbi:MAG TPA: MlaD family protein [Vicinamibacterales bacterium]|nr:MlaD family protein [Vicinamibacterales bacterium]
MPRTRSLAWSELKIGILAVVAIALAALLIIAIGGQAGFSWQRYLLKTRFDNVNGLKTGAVVRVAGVEVGKVTDVSFVGANVQVSLSVKNDMQPRITTDSRASIGSLSLLGEPVIDISPSATGTPLKDGDFIQSQHAAGQISDVAASASEGIAQLTGLLKDLRAGKGTMGKLFTDEDLYRELDRFVTSAQTVASYVSSGKGTLGMLAKDPKAYQQLSAALTNLRETTDRINAGEGTLGRLLKDDTLARSLTSASGNVDQITGRLNRGQGTLGKLLTEQELYNRLNSVTAHLDQLTSALNQGQGTAGQLLHDKQLYDNMNQAASELRQLIANINRDPKKYLNIKVSIF